ncbi:MAG: DUF3240 family protein [Gammaproteobacteria bacterium]
MSDLCLLILNVPVALEDSITDWLLADDPDRGFTSLATRGHHARSSGLTARERVTGHVRRTRFEIECEAAAGAALIERLRDAYPRADVRFRLVPVLDRGVFD